MKLEVGMYVRTKEGHMDKIIKIDNKALNGRTIQVKKGELDYCMGYEDFTDLFNPSHYEKASFNIIDLIEVGDYVNGEKVIALKKDISERNIHFNSKKCNIFTDYSLVEDWYFGIEDKDIKTIVTKEQYKNIEYIIGE